MNIQGTSAVVTGAANGIGRAIAIELAARGVNVVVVDLEIEPAKNVATEITASGGSAVAIEADVTQPSALTKVAEDAWRSFGSIELLFNNAGVLPGRASIFESTPENARWIFSVNVEGVINGIREFLPRFIESGKNAYVVNTGSEHSLGVPHTGAGLYTASKHAILGLSDVLRREVPDHIGVGVLCPGLVQSTLWRSEERRLDEHATTAVDPVRGKFSESFGMPASEVAQRVLSGIEQDAFLIPTHAHVIDYAQDRAREIELAFEQQAPRYDGDEKYDVEKLVTRLTKN
ncbi:MAG: SDR family NAD(P)-dependent oxidoreductase [Pseudomonadota bacterium]